jgi:tRNA G18 (ribose-2'-O)-methylase SpoU
MKKKQYSIVFGIHPIKEVIRAKKRKIYEVYISLSTPQSVVEIVPQLPSYCIIKKVAKSYLDQLSHGAEH